MKKIVLLRHGESAWNRENRFTGWTDVDLTDKGVEEALKAGELLKAEGFRFGKAYTSYLKRAVRTLNCVLDRLDQEWIPVEKNWRLNEKHYGVLQGLNKSETAARFGEEQVHIWQGDFMAVFRVPKIENFTMMSNHHLRNKKLSLKAVGLMSKILSLPDEWDYSLKGLAKLNADGIDGVRSAVQELEDAGYIIRRQRRDKNGRMAQSEYLVFEIPELSKPALDSPSSEKPIPVKPATDVPTSGNPMQINTKQVITHQENTHLNNTPSINHSGTGRRNDGTDWMDERERYREIIEENIEYEIMKDRPDGDRLGEIVEIMLDAVCSTAPTIRINGEDMPQQVVKSRFLKLDSSHIEYVFHAMKECPSNIRNIRAYLLTTLYNAPATMDNFYSAKVNHDFNGW